jgi:hypothetical protein
MSDHFSQCFIRFCPQKFDKKHHIILFAVFCISNKTSSSSFLSHLVNAFCF